MRCLRVVLIALGLLLVTILIVGLVLWNTVAPRAAVRAMQKAMAENCITCRIAIDHPHLGFFPGQTVSLNDISFYGGERDHSDVQVIADSVEISWHPLALLRHQLVLASVTIINPFVILSEGDSPSRFAKGEKPAAARNKKPSDWTFEVDEMNLEGATFTYRRVHDEKLGELHATNLSGHASAWGTTSEDLKNAVGEAEVKGRVEKSGRGLLKIAMPVLRVEKQHIDVDLTLEGLNLEELAYLKACEGVALKGTLIKSHAQVFIRDRKYHAKNQMEYENLDVTLEKTKTQGALRVFFSNLLADVLVRKQNADKTPNEQTRETDGERGDDESVPHFILRGLKESAMKIAVAGVKPDTGKKPKK